MTMKTLIRKLLLRWSEDSGQALGEFSLIIAFIAVVCIAALTALGVAVLIPYSDLLASGFGGGGS